MIIGGAFFYLFIILSTIFIALIHFYFDLPYAF